MSQKVKNLLTRIQARNDRLKFLEDSSVPFIGIFYIIGKDLYWEGYPSPELQFINGIKNYPKEHFQYWKYSLSKIRPDLQAHDYQYFPRGRVICLEENEEYEVYCDRCVKNSDYYQHIINDEMRLPYTTQYLTDRYYKCNRCK